MSLIAKIEAILYLKGEPLELKEIVERVQADRKVVKLALTQIMSDYAQRETALEVIEIKGKYTLQLRETYRELIDTLIPPELGVGALRTLAAIALNKGMAQTQLVELRGSGAYQQVQELVEQGFIHKRKQAETRSYWLQVTKKFHQYFQVDQLPHQLALKFETRDVDQTTKIDPSISEAENEELEV
ncbi:MAG: SMC-Scp complex subunit ScpB [Microcoleaceae cyanobacterium]